MREDYTKMKIAIRYWLLGKGYFNALRAMEMAENLHVNLRKDGEAEFSHQISQVNFMKAFDGILLYPEQTFSTIFLHDTMEDYDVTYESILSITDKLTADAVVKMSKVIKGNKTPNELYYFGMGECPISSAAKGADRLHNMMTMIGGFTPMKQISYCVETLDFTIPMLKQARRSFPEQDVMYENMRYILRNQIILYNEINKDYVKED